jgi:hypothetical protein
MSVVPTKPIEKVQFYEAHLTPWNTNSAAIGLLPADLTDLTTKTTAARDAFNAKEAAQQASRAATQAFHDAVDAMANTGAFLINKIRVKAEQTGGNSVYNLAEIPPPATPSPVGPPGTPYQLKVELLPNGSLAFKWKCDNPAGSSGTLYHVYRKIGTAPGEFTFIGGSGARSFVDTTVPSGAATIVYQIQAARTTSVGVANEFVVNFGMGSGGQMTASIVESNNPPKMAA